MADSNDGWLSGLVRSLTCAGHHVDGPSLRLLSREDLNDLGVATVGHRLQILRGVAELDGQTHPKHQGALRARGLDFGDEADGKTAQALQPVPLPCGADADAIGGEGHQVVEPAWEPVISRELE